MKTNQSHKDRGFTLIELSIVLVIIGLITGGVLVGRDLIEAAKVRNDISTIERMNAAALTFRLKYNYLPGDLPNATNLGFNVVADSSTVGNKRVDIASNSVWSMVAPNSSVPEWSIFFNHLYQEKLFETPNTIGTFADLFTTLNGANAPGLVFPKMQSPQGGASGFPGLPGMVAGYECNNRVCGHFIRMNFSKETVTIMGFRSAFTPTNAKLIDAKFDDGNALSGGIQAALVRNLGSCADDVLDTNSGCWGNIGNSGNSTRCLLDATQNYDTDFDERWCALRFKASF
ncbi:MAG: prepilin-type N-terminal cleavage/methylation domain-containing protein [Planctomycetales bacterium]|nr:prepilin-type N-terminal cleavage/methylation domain-containing protein [Planctomycetales bacterium]